MGLETKLYRTAFLIRRVEERLVEVYPSDAVQSPLHVCIGSEGVCVGVCAALQPQDVVLPYYRSHGVYLAKGGNLKALIAELYGRATGCGKGWSGSMHATDASAGIYGTSAIVASPVPNAVGMAYAFKLRGEDRVVACWLGEAACEEGAFWESLNFAALHKLPVLFAIEDSGYAINSPTAERQAGNLRHKIEAFGVTAVYVDGGRALDVYLSADLARRQWREWALPLALICKVDRHYDHVGVGFDYGQSQRTWEDYEIAKAADPLPRLAALLPPDERALIEAEVDAEVEEAFRVAEAAPFPKAEDLWAL